MAQKNHDDDCDLIKLLLIAHDKYTFTDIFSSSHMIIIVCDYLPKTDNSSSCVARWNSFAVLKNQHAALEKNKQSNFESFRNNIKTESK